MSQADLVGSGRPVRSRISPQCLTLIILQSQGYLEIPVQSLRYISFDFYNDYRCYFIIQVHSHMIIHERVVVDGTPNFAI